VLKDLTVLTPPLLVCVAFLIAVGAFLRHEMGTARRRRRDQDASDDISGDTTIADTGSNQAAAHSDEPGASRAD
jgi:hypothetical protein